MTTARLDHTDPDVRRTFVGGSDIAAVMGQSHWKTRLQLWAEKTGNIPAPDLSDVEHVQMGTKLESFIADEFAERTEKKIRRDSRTFVHPEFPYMVYHVDRWIVGEDAMLECKNTSEFRAKDWEGESVPVEYVLQVNWGLGLMQKKVGYFCALVGGNRIRIKSVEFSEELFARQVAAAKDFWENFVLKNIAPLAGEGDSETLQQLFPTEQSEVIEFAGDAAEHFNHLIEERQGGVEQKKLVEAEIDNLTNQIKQLLGEKTEGRTAQYTATWKAQRVAPFLDTEKLKADGVYEKYELNNQSRVMRTKATKGIKK